jgi:hypothetical protein
VQRADLRLRLAVVADRGPRLLDAAVQRRVADDTAAPQGLEELRARHGAVAIRDEIDQQLEDLRLYGDGLPLAPQLETRRIELEVLEPVDHGGLKPPSLFSTILHQIITVWPFLCAGISAH